MSSSKSKQDLGLAIIIPDTHAPYHDRRAWKILQQVCLKHKKKITEIVFLGDFADFYAVNSHGRHPSVMGVLIEEIETVNSMLDWFDEHFPSTKKVFLEGNHEYRLERYLVNNAPALFGVTETRELLQFTKRPNWKFVPYGPNQSHMVLGSYLNARHEPLGSSAKATASKALCSLVYGHIHRIERSHLVGLDGTDHVCFSVGWLGDKKKDKIFGYVKQHAQWQLGFCIVWVDKRTRYFYPNTIQILDNYSCVVGGEIFKA